MDSMVGTIKPANCENCKCAHMPADSEESEDLLQVDGAEDDEVTEGHHGQENQAFVLRWTTEQLSQELDADGAQLDDNQNERPELEDLGEVSTSDVREALSEVQKAAEQHLKQLDKESSCLWPLYHKFLKGTILVSSVTIQRRENCKKDRHVYIFQDSEKNGQKN